MNNKSELNRGSGTPRFHYGFVIVACCCLMMGVNIGLTFSCAGIFYRPVSESIGVSVGKFGIYMSLMYVASSLMLPLAGRMLERYSARRLFSLNSLVMGLTFLAMALFDNVWEFYLAGAVLGATLSFLLYLSFPTMINRWFRSKVGLLIGVCSAASGIGGMLFNPVAGAIITAYGWRVAYGVFAAVIILVVTPLLYIFLRDYPADKGLQPYGAEDGRAGEVKTSGAASDGIAYGQAVRMPVFYLLILFSFLMMGISTLNLFIPDYTGSLGFSLEQASLAAAAAMAGVTSGKLILGYINDLNCRAGVLVTALGGAAGLAVMMLASHGSLWPVLLGAFFFGWAYAGVTVQTAMLTREVFGNRSYSRIYSIISIALAAGGAVASGGWGLLADATGFRCIFTTGALLLVVCAVIGVFSLSRKK